MNNLPNRVEEICEKLFQNCKNPVSELHYGSDYAFLIAVVMSAQTTDVQVNKVTYKLFQKYDTIDKILSLGEEGLREKIKSIGLFKNKAKNIIALSRILREKFHSIVPHNREDLESLPGVGRKSANVVLNTLFNKDVIAVDTHVLRISKRLGFSESTDPKKVEADLEKIIPQKYKRNISNLIVLHGRYTCKAKKPLCHICIINNFCQCKDKIII